MLFSSLTFLFAFLPLLLVLYYALKNRSARNIILLIFSLGFYAWGEPLYILLMLFIPLAIIQFLKAHIDFKLISVLMSLTLYGGFYIVVQMSRKEALLNIKDEIEQPIINTLLKPIMIYLKTQKKRLSNKRYINDQAYILRASFKKNNL